MSWPKKPLAEVADFQLGKMLDQVKNRGNSRPYLANKNVRWGNFDFSELREMRFEESEFERFSLKHGDIVMCEGGEPGRCAIWRDELPNIMFQKALHRIRPFEEMDSVFLYYNLSHRARSGHFNGLLTGATIKHLPREKLALVQVDVPELPTQQRIAEILSAYDDLIENNRRRIGLLEQAARLLYREWFVHLRFPRHETAKIADGLPEGWRIGSLHEAFEQFIDGDWIESKDQSGEDFRILQISNVGVNRFVETGNWRFISTETFKRLRCTEVLPGDFLLSRMPTPIGRAWRVTPQPFRMVTAVDVTIGRPTAHISDMYLLHTINSDRHLAQCEGHAVGATRQRISRKNMGNLPLVFPTMDIQEKFQMAISPINQKQTTLEEAINRLTRARDLLLPRLMDGRIPV